MSPIAVVAVSAAAVVGAGCALAAFTAVWAATRGWDGQDTPRPEPTGDEPGALGEEWAAEARREWSEVAAETRDMQAWRRRDSRRLL